MLELQIYFGHLLNTAWEIDEYFPERSSINNGALSRCLLQADQQIKDSIKKAELLSDDKVIKIAIWHHPVTGNEKVKVDSFLEQLQKFDVNLCLHGHIHEEKAELLYHLHPTRKIHIAGAGSFGAIAKNRPSSTPRLYNLIQIDQTEQKILVNTRGRRRDDGKWAAWNIYPGENSKEGQSFYEIELT